MYTFIDSKEIQGVGTVNLYQHQNGTFQLTVVTSRGEFEAKWANEESAYEVYTKIVDIHSMVKIFELGDVL